MAKVVITLTNDFHNSSVSLRVEVDDEGNAKLSINQIKKRRELCCAGCSCSGEVGTRGYQHDVDSIEPVYDDGGFDSLSGAWVHLRGY